MRSNLTRRVWKRVSYSVAASALALLPAALTGADSATAAPSAGYTAQYIATEGTPAGVGVDSATGTVYVSAGEQVLVINGTNDTTVATIALSQDAGSVAVDSASDTVYVEEGVGTTAPELAVIDGATNSLTGTIAFPAGEGIGLATAVDTQTDQIYVAAAGSATGVVTPGVFDIDGSTGSVAARFNTSGAVTPSGIAVDEPANTLWVASRRTQYEEGTVDELDASSGAILANIPSIGAPVGDPAAADIAVDPVTDTVYAAVDESPNEGGADGLTVIDGATATVTATVSATGLESVAVDPAADVVYVTAGQAGITVVDGATDTIAETLPAAAAQAVAIDTATGVVYAPTPTPLPPGVWKVSPSAQDSVSPIISGSDPSPPSLTVGTDGAVDFLVSGEPYPHLTETGTLPSGVTLPGGLSTPPNQLGGTPAAGSGGVYPLTITASNGVQPDYSENITLTVNEAPSLTAPTAETLHTGEAASIPIGVHGYPAPAVSASPLPAGLSLVQQQSGNWQLTGTPAAGSVGTYQTQLQATSSLGTVTKTLTLTVAAPPAPAVAVAVLTAGGVPYAMAPQLGSGWHSLGGKVTAVPAVVAVPNPNGASPASPLFIAPGANHLLYIRGVTGSWQRLYPNDTSCLSVAAVITAGSVLQVACETTSHGLSYATASTAGSGLPQFGTLFRSLGDAGTVTAGPAIARVNGTLTFFITAGGKVQSRTIPTAFRATGWACSGQPAAATQGTTGVTYFACEGTNHVPYEGTVTSAGLSAATRLSGALAAGPALAPDSAAVEILVESSNREVYQRTAATAYVKLGTLQVTGVQAVALN